MTSDAGQGAPAVTLLEPHAPSMAQLAKRLAGIEACADWQLLPDMLTPARGEHVFYQYSLAAENSLLPLEALRPLWPGLLLQSENFNESVELANLLPASWLLVDCLPAANLLQSTRLPASTQVVLARVLLANDAPSGASLTDVHAVLNGSGFKAVAAFAERNSAIGKVLFVRDPAQLQSQLDQTRQALEAETQDRAAEQKAKDQVLAEMRHCCDELTKAREEEAKAKVELQSQLDQTRQALETETQERVAEQKAKDQVLAEMRHCCDELTKAREEEAKAKVELQSQLDQTRQALEAETQDRAAEQKAKDQVLAEMRHCCDELTKAREEEAKAKVELQSQLDQTRQALEAETQDRAAEQKAKDQVLAEMRHCCDELTKAREEEAKAKVELQSQLDQTRQALEAENSAIKKDFHSIKFKLLQSETLLQTTLTVGSEASTQLRFNSKSDGIYKNKQGLVKYDLPGNTPAYLVSNEAGDFDIAPKLNSLRLEPNKAYEFTGTVIFEGPIQPVVWLFEYDQHNKKINSHTFTTQNGEFRAFLKTQANSASYAIGIRLAGSGSLNPQNTGFKLENSLAIEVAEAMQHSHTGFDKKLIELQTKLQKELQSQNQNSLRQIESFLRLQNYCGDRMVLPDMHGWPVSPDLGVYIIRLVETGGFDAIVEFGSGVSTQLIALALQKAADQPDNSASTPFLSFEHLEPYLQQTQAQLHQAQLSESVELVYAPLIETSGAQNKPSLYYDCKDTLQQLRQSITKPNPKLLVFVDGPPAATDPLARFPAMQAIEQAFEGRAEVHYLMDDYIRQDERNIVDLWQAHLQQQGRQVEKQELKQFEKQACLLITKAQS
ncbi:class I SAM-dependent methyltransferase [Limnohabitans sp. INBF002]|uniref:class I SAM-dependent methyltransferase n=1 Tax=Limnohabitans sp. INBF002 TaxID=2986280 RepID=UPI00248FE709|nr:class I SAM-dependent methyltransferase [Limnohabitans sp. INBF002]